MRTFQDTPLAIVGMACRVPGADDLDQFWQLLVEGGCAIAEAPPERIDRRLYFDPDTTAPYKTYTVTGGMITYPPFDPARCPVPKHTLAEAEIGHQTICQVAAEACRHAGLNPFDLPLRNGGVYVGHNLGGPVAGDLIYSTHVETTAQYLREIEAFCQAAGTQADELIAQLVARIRNQLPRRGPLGSPEGSTRLAAAIISESLGLSGPSIILDAACSSALQGLVMAARGLQLGRIDMAVVAGASYFHVDSQLVFSKAQSASRRACSCPFDADADGLVSGEGYVAVIVKTLERALADGDPVQCVLRGIGVSSDGRGKSLWAPRKEGQALAIRRAYQNGLDLGRLQYIEAHATSTRVGDMTELKALAEVLGGHISPEAKIPMGGVKANIGHTLESAGLAGLVKTVLAMQHKTIPRQINVRKLNPGIDWDTAPFYIPMENVEWPAFADGHPRRAAVNSFGIGGLNVHVVLDEHATPAEQSTPAAQPTAGSALPATVATGGQDPIAIIGAGCIFPGARTLENFWDLLSSGRDPKCDVPADRWNAQLAYEPGSRRPGRSPTKRGGFITNFQCDWRRHKIPPNQVDKADPLQLMILDATDAALADAGYATQPYDKSRVGVVVGTMFGSDFCEQLQMGFRLGPFCDELTKLLRSKGIAEDQIAAIADAYPAALLRHMTAIMDETGGFTPSTLASRITKMYDLMGGAVTIDAGQASSLAAIYSAVDTLLDGTCDMVVCAAGHRAMGLTTYEVMSLAGQLAEEPAAAPLDAQARGHLPGEGVGVVVLKRLADAQRDGNPIRGIIRGMGAGFSPNHQHAVSQAIGRAQAVSGTSTSQELLLETCGTGQPEWDNPELAAVAEQLASGPRSAPLLVSSLVGQIGHTQGASGMASLLAAMRSLDTFEVTSRCGLNSPGPAISAHGARLRLANEKISLPHAGAETQLLAGVNSLDIYGSAYHLILERGQSAPLEAPAGAQPAAAEVATAARHADVAPATYRIVRLAAATVEALRDRIGQALAEVDRHFAEADSARFLRADAVRLAVVAESAADLADKWKQAAEQIGTPKSLLLARKDIFFGQVAGPPGKVAFLFSGQGSQYAGMLRPLVEQFPPARQAMQRIDQELSGLGIANFAEFAWERPEALGKDVWMTQLSLLCADTIVFESLRAVGIEPAFVAGHSFGEFPALCAAGAWDFDQAVRGTRARCEAIEACAHVQGSMLSVAAPGPRVEQLCRQVGGNVFPANYNAPDQTVVGGDDESISRLEAQLKAEKVAYRRLAVPRPFHTPLMADTRVPLAAGLAPIVMRAPRLPVLSSVTNRPVTSVDEMRSNLVAQMTSPVRYVDLIGQLADQGVRALVEVGPHQVLTGLNQKIMADRNVVAIACDDKARGGLARLLAVRACLESQGLLDEAAASTRPQTVSPRPADLKKSANGQARVGQPLGLHSTTSNGHAMTTGSDGRKLPAAAVAADAGAGVLVLTGSPTEIGRAHGEALAVDIRRIARRYTDVAGQVGDSEVTSDLARLDQSNIDQWPAEWQQELRGVAEGAGVSPKVMALYNVWGDRCLAEQAAQVAVMSDGPGASPLQAQDERASDRQPWGTLNLSPSLRVYRPASGLAHAVVAWPGMLGGSAGINDEGIAITSAGLDGQCADGQSSTLRSLLVRRVLQSAATVDAAIDLLRSEAGRVLGQFCISHASSKKIHVVRLGADGAAQLFSDTAIVLVTRPATVAVARSTAANAATAQADSETAWPGELLALADRQAAGLPIDAESLPSPRQLEEKFAVVLDPARREVSLRPADGRSIQRYRFAARQQASAAAPTTAPPKPASAPNPGSSKAATKPVLTSGVRTISASEYLAAATSVGGQPPFEQHGEICQRFVLKTLRTPVPTIKPQFSSLGGPALIVGRNAVTVELRKQIEALGEQVLTIPLSDDVDTTLTALDKIWTAYRPLNLFLVTPWDEDAATDLNSPAWQRRRHRGVTLPFRICQRWYNLLAENHLVEKASVTAAVVMGGDFGLSGHVTSVESGALGGLIKGLCIEVGLATTGQFRTKIVDAPRDQPPAEVAASLLHELRAGSPFLEVGYVGQKRYGNCAMPRRLEPTSHQQQPTRGRPWLVTGGARGVTAAVARELGARFGVKLHLVGASPRVELDPAVHALSAEERKQHRAQLARQAIAEKKLPVNVWKSWEKAVEIDKNLRDMQAAGIAVTYHACDVSDRTAVERLLDEIRRTDGPLEGVVHGAGIEIAGRFGGKDPHNVQRTIASKVDGAAHLMELTGNDPLRFFIGFGSISGRWGSIGQTDYCLASDMLAKLIDWYRARRPECHATCFHWHPWADIGMASRDETRGAQVLQNLRLLPAPEGVRHFIDELLAGCPEPEVIVTDWEYYKRFYPDALPEIVSELFCADTVDDEPTAHAPALVGAMPEAVVAVPEPAAVSTPQVALRQVMRMIELPGAACPRRTMSFAGQALILGDNADARALAARLESDGVTARQIPIGQSIEQTLGELQWMFSESPAPHLFVLTGREPGAASVNSRQTWLERRQRGVMLPLAVCQKWLTLVGEANLLDRASLVAVTNLGGDFGFAESVAAPENGALTGLIKGLYMEMVQAHPNALRMKLIDAPLDESPERLAAAIVDELEIAGFDVEVAYVAGQRRVVRLLPEPVEQLPHAEIARGGTWIFTGGARGITAAVARHFGQRYGLKLHLLGASPLPELDPAIRDGNPAKLQELKRALMRKALADKVSPGTYWDRVRKDLEIDRNLRELKALGIEATYHACDVTNWDQLSQTLDTIRAADGPISGIVHGAGTHGAALTIDETPLDIVSELVDVKVDAAMNLMLLTRQDPIRYFVGFGSISGRFGSANAAAYTLASDLLCKLIGWYRRERPDCRAVGFHWHPWGEVGMMTRPVSQHTVKVFKMKMMPPAEGAAHLIDELCAGAPESEILITDRQFSDTFYSPEMILTEPPQPSGDRPAPALIERVVECQSGQRAVAEIRLHPLNDPFLSQHRLRNRPLLPLVVALESFVETASLLAAGRSIVACRDVEITDAVRFHTDDPLEVRVTAEAEGSLAKCRLTSDFCNRRGQLVQKDRLHFSATVELADAPLRLQAAALPEPQEWFDIAYPSTDAPLYHGPPLRLLRRMGISGQQAVGEVLLPERDDLVGARSAAGWLIPSAAIDACLYACGVYAWVCGEQGFTIPAGLAELQFGRAARAGERTTVQVTCRELENTRGLFDFALLGDDGAVIFRATGYQCHVLRGPAA